jgi:hypothetical protein
MATLAPAGMAQGNSGKSGVSVPVAGTVAGGGKFAGTFNIQRCAAQDGKVVAIGVISGPLTDSAGDGVPTGLQTGALPVTLSSGPAAAAARPADGEAKFVKTSYDRSGTVTYLGAAGAVPAQASCEILRLSIGAINLNLLGLQVSLSPILLVITAQPAGGLLGQLLCASANLLNPPGPLTQLIALLNQLLALLNSL